MIYLTLSGVVLAFLFMLDIYPPLQLGVLLLWGFAVWGIFSIRVNNYLSILSRFMILLYMMPFIVTIGYLFDVNFIWWLTPDAEVLQQDNLLITQMISVGLVGLLGLLAGLRWGGVSHLCSASAKTSEIPEHLHILNFWFFAGLLGLALFFSWLQASPTTLFEAAYASIESGEAAAVRVNFNALSLIAYIILVLLYIDAEREPFMRRRRLKRMGVLAVAGVIVIFFQVLRGDRDSLGLVFGLTALYLTGPVRSVQDTAIWDSPLVWRRARRMAPLIIIVLLVFLGLGAVRQSLANQEGRKSISLHQTVAPLFFGQNTWTAVLLTNLAMADQYRAGGMEYLYGQTYLDYFLSLPPGVLTQGLGYKRPLESDRGPNWWFEGISCGGIHPALVPFKNFGIPGVFVILALWGYLIARWDNPVSSVWNRLLYGAVFASSFNWFWYGDMNIIRALMAAVLLYIMYSILVRVRFVSHFATQDEVCV